MNVGLAILFLVVACFYASVGFGGGSSYLALLVLWGVPFTVMPAIALICNIIVVTGNCWHYSKAGYLKWALFLPPALFSVPFAYLGGTVEINQSLFITILMVCLALAGLKLLFTHQRFDDDQLSYHPISFWITAPIGALLGFISGLVGIGGGIFLAPVLYHLRAGKPKEIALTASLFILVNSISGLIGQLQKTSISDQILEYWYLPVAVLVGGQMGNLLTIRLLPSRIIALLTSVLILLISVRLGFLLMNGS